MSAKPQGVGLGLVSQIASFLYPGVLPDWAIREYISIDNFVDYDECPPGAISYGLTSAGYDLRVGYRFKIFTNVECATVDPKNMKPSVFKDLDLTGHEWGPHSLCDECGAHRESSAARMSCKHFLQERSVLIPPNSFALSESIEVLYIPKNVVCWCIGKSTLARCGIITAFTPFEPGWFGVVTIEISNSTPLPVKIYAGEGIGQAQFVLMAGTPEKTYGDKKNAKYQGQTGITLPRVT